MAEGGGDVVLQSRRRESLDGALERMRKNHDQMIAASLLTPPDAEAARTRVRLTLDLGDAVRDADFVSENVPGFSP
ncbi:MAG: 3-hydroxyacyl-CoA dehydrogenase NAD-binding domain-containing protein [Candidatus Rokuibacteriota bacterium]